MSTKTPAVPAAPAAKAADPAKPAKVKKPKQPRQVVRLYDAGKNQLRFTAKQRENGSVSFATHVVRQEDGKAKSIRGASAKHASFDEAKSAVAAGVAAATKLGWGPKGKGGGGSSKADNFTLDSLPAPLVPAAK